MLMLILLGFASATLMLLCCVWRDGYRRRKALRDQLDRLSSCRRGRPRRRRG
jgi:hypothetical protein